MNLVTFFLFSLLFISLSMAETSQGRDSVALNNSSGAIKGRLVDKNSKSPLAGVNISLKGTRRGSVSDQNGNFEIQDLKEGSYTIIAEYMGFSKIIVKNITLQTAQITHIKTIEMVERAIPLNEIVVTPGNYSIMGDEPSIRQTLSSEDIKIMGWAEDITRAVHRIPGISSNDYSAKFNVRGGGADEVLVLFDGMQIYQPFHQKDFAGGIFSTVDIETIDNVNLLTGGFTADYGNRISGVLNMNSKTAKDDERKTSLGFSFVNAQAFSLGTFNNNQGKWLFSARRGYLDILNKIMANEFKLEPVYYDVFGKFEYNLNPNHTLALHGFLANDSYLLDEEEFEPGKTVPNIDYVDTEYGNAYGWLTLKSLLNKDLYVRSIIYGGSVTKNRFWDRFDDDPNFHLTIAQLNDKRDFTLFGAKQDWNWQASKIFNFKFGADVKSLDVKFKYSNNLYYEYISADDSLAIRDDSLFANKSESGTQLGLYFSSRFLISAPLVLETGVRFDHSSYSNDEVWSPRLNLVYSFTNKTFLRAGWGYYYQSQEIDQLRIQFGENSYNRAEKSKQFVLGLEHFFTNGMHLRAESYWKNSSNVPAAYYTFANIDEFFPEARDDLFKVSFDKTISRGVELYLKYDTGNEFSWWMSYVLSDAKEFYSEIDYPGIITKKLGEQSRPWDQRHTLNFDINYRHNTDWHFNLSWIYRSGWPYTPYEVKRKEREDGTFAYYHEFGTFNSANFPAYHRLDLRLNRYFYPSMGKITLYFQIINLYNQENIASYDHEIVNESADSFKSVTEKESWFGLTPLLGVKWEF